MLDVPLPLKVVGSGPLARLFEPSLPGSNGLASAAKAAVAALMRDAEFLIFPSEWLKRSA